MAEVQEFENVESGASLTYPAAAGSIRKGAHIVIKGRPCKVGFFSSTRLCLAWVFTFVQVPRCVPVYFIFLLLSLSLSLSLSTTDNKNLCSSSFVSDSPSYLKSRLLTQWRRSRVKSMQSLHSLSLSLSLSLSHSPASSSSSLFPPKGGETGKKKKNVCFSCFASYRVFLL